MQTINAPRTEAAKGNTMKVDFVNPFVDAARSVLETELGVAVNKGTVSLQSSAYTTQDVTVLIGVMGAVQGVVLYGMSQKTALNIVGAMMGQAFPEFDELAQSGIAELGNVITGLAATGLENAGYSSRISPPTSIVGHGSMISTLDIRRLVVPLITDFGAVEIHVALREAAK
jgi:chemotaxis protein CheX